jgi:hypothetical protein
MTWCVVTSHNQELCNSWKHYDGVRALCRAELDPFSFGVVSSLKAPKHYDGISNRV